MSSGRLFQSFGPAEANERPNGLTYTDQIWYDNTWGRNVFVGVSYAHSKKTGAQRPKILCHPC